MKKTDYEKLLDSTYDLEDLIEIFVKHEGQADKNGKKLIKAFKENNPGKPLPDYLADEFNLPRALMTFAIEINELKKQLNHLSDEYHGYDP